MSFMHVPRDKSGLYYFAERAGKFPKRRLGRIDKLLWVEDEGELFINCANCGTINDLGQDGVCGFWVYEDYPTAQDKVPDVVTPCIYCVKCNARMVLALKDWSKVSKKTRDRYAFTRFRRIQSVV